MEGAREDGPWTIIRARLSAQNEISKRLPSTTRPSLRLESVAYGHQLIRKAAIVILLLMCRDHLLGSGPRRIDASRSTTVRLRPSSIERSRAFRFGGTANPNQRTLCRGACVPNRGIVMRCGRFHELPIASGKSTDVARERKQDLLIGHRDWKALGYNDRRNASHSGFEAAVSNSRRRSSGVNARPMGRCRSGRSRT